jgi:cytochrome c oxidase assembly factor CtaG
MLSAAQIVIVGIMALAYGLRARHLARAGAPVPRAKLLWAAVGLAALPASMLALASSGKELLYWRTVEHLLIGDLACLPIALGLTGAVLSPLARTPLRHLRLLSRPPLALALWTANLLVWQLPAIFDATLRHDYLTFLQQALLIALGVNMWVALLRGVLSAERPIGEGRAAAYVTIGRLIAIGVACIGIWSPDVYYPYYLRGDSASSTSPLADQGIAGAVTLGEMALIAICLLLWMSSRTRQAAAHASLRSSAHAAEPDAAGAAGSGALAIETQA